MSTDKAVRKAGRDRLLHEFRAAAWAIQSLRGTSAAFAHAYVLGMIEGTGSQSAQACLLTAFGG